MKNKEIRKPITRNISECKKMLNVLEKNLSNILSQKIWEHKVPISEKITYLKEIAILNTRLWSLVESEYPQYYNKDNVITITDFEVIIKKNAQPKD